MINLIFNHKFKKKSKRRYINVNFNHGLNINDNDNDNDLVHSLNFSVPRGNELIVSTFYFDTFYLNLHITVDCHMFTMDGAVLIFIR